MTLTDRVAEIRLIHDDIGPQRITRDRVDQKVTTIEDLDSQGQPDMKFEYGYDPDGRLQSILTTDFTKNKTTLTHFWSFSNNGTSYIVSAVYDSSDGQKWQLSNELYARPLIFAPDPLEGVDHPVLILGPSSDNRKMLDPYPQAPKCYCIGSLDSTDRSQVTADGWEFAQEYFHSGRVMYPNMVEPTPKPILDVSNIPTFTIPIEIDFNNPQLITKLQLTK